MKNSNDSLILGIDHGYGNIKTANKTFGTGVYVSDTEPAFKDILLTWNGKYHTIGEGHKEFVADKIQDIHNHFVFNSVSFVDGKKYNDDKRNLYRLREVSDELCKEYKLSVVLNPKKSRGIPYNEYMNEKNMKLTKNAIIKTEIDETILTAISRKDFFNQMKKKGYTFNFTSRYSTVYHPAFKRATRLITLGDDYVPVNLIKRIDESWRRYPVNIPPQDNLYKQYIGDEPIVGYAQTYVKFITIVEAVRKRLDNNRQAKFLCAYYKHGQSAEWLIKIIKKYLKRVFWDSNL